MKVSEHIYNHNVRAIITRAVTLKNNVNVSAKSGYNRLNKVERVCPTTGEKPDKLEHGDNTAVIQNQPPGTECAVGADFCL